MTPPLPDGIALDQYRTQAKELLKQIRAALPEALNRLRKHHPEQDALAAALDRIRLADAQLVLARENGCSSWTTFKHYILFRNAVQALDAGDRPRLEALLDEHPWLLRYHCRVGEPYEQGYFAGATLLNHIAGNPIRCPLPPNILDITRLLLNHGARDEPPRPNYTIGLLLTSKPASEAGVALPLIDMLVEAGATFDPDKLSVPLQEGAFATAEALIQRGARVDIRHAAALGRLDLVQRLVHNGADVKLDASLIPLPEDPEAARAQREEAFRWACMWGRSDVAEFLLDDGVDPSAGAGSGQTGLHIAVHMGQSDTVKRLLARHVPLEVRNEYGGTVLGQAVWSAINEPRETHIPIIHALLDAGANLDTDPTLKHRVEELLRHP